MADIAKTTKLVWDTSALLNLKEPNAQGYSPAASLYKDFSDGWIRGPYQNIFPVLAVFELQASISRMHREGRKVIRDFYVVGENAVVYPIDQALIDRCADLLAAPGFSALRGADLIFACIAHIEDAFLLTLDKGFSTVSSIIRVIDLNESRDSPKYRRVFEEPMGAEDAL